MCQLWHNSLWSTVPRSYRHSSSKRQVGNQPVRDWIKGLSSEDRHLVCRDIQKVEFGWSVGMPYCRSLGNGLWEVRSDLTDGKIGRVVFCVVRGRMVLLHSFIKKTQKTPAKDIELALRRMKEVE
jgi:phage-related protein